ncbi:hypothetical protein NA57DRAFT_81006 [Rhizodiscina lignyota]|uniref:Uncharacterized protein n=1 Tax=Rhizodiscina lignyota TaxID=1504668 RepID=A0A9P4M1V6_9PEZI|nr:hypothetical protein NA57DRAFT_81006 [Rhizodiscina lignyota]
MSTLPGFSAAETIILAAAYYHAKTADVDFEAVAKHVKSKSVQSVKERLRCAKKKTIDLSSDSSSSNTKAPSGGIDKKSPSKVKKATPRKAKAPKRAAPVTPTTSETEKEDKVKVEMIENIDTDDDFDF